MRLKLGSLIWIWTVLDCGNTVPVAANDNSSGDGGNYDGNNSNIVKPDYNWFPRLNVTCINRKLAVVGNPSCSAGTLTQNCAGEEGCATSQRTISCTEAQINTDASQYAGGTYNYQECSTFQGVGCGQSANATACKVAFTGSRMICKCVKLGPSNLGQDGGDEGAQNPIQTIAFTLAGTVMVGLLLFAVIRIRKSSLRRRYEGPRERREVQGVDNEALGAPLPNDSRLQTILNTINANGRNYELRERADSVPGRRVYVLSPTNSEQVPRGRGFSRTTSQLSSIAEESVEDAMSHITEATEPVEDDCVFKYDSDTINEVERIHSSDCAFDDEIPTKPTSSTEAIDCINDVIAMYDVENEANNGLDEAIKDNAVIPSSDFRRSLEYSGEDYLKAFGWKPQDRAWKIEKLKDENSKSNERLYASCSTLDSRYSGASSTASLGNSDDATVDDVNSSTPLISNGDVIMSILKPCQSLPSVLDTSQIPDIEEVLATTNGDCRVTDDEDTHS